MSDILQSTGMSKIAVQFTEAAADGWFELSYVQGKYNTESIVLDRTELQALYGRIQNIMAAELWAAGFVETKRLNDERWFSLPPFNKAAPLDEAWRIMKGAQNAE